MLFVCSTTNDISVYESTMLEIHIVGRDENGLCKRVIRMQVVLCDESLCVARLLSGTEVGSYSIIEIAQSTNIKLVGCLYYSPVCLPYSSFKVATCRILKIAVSTLWFVRGAVRSLIQLSLCPFAVSVMLSLVYRARSG